MRIYGIPCRVRSPAVRRAIRIVLGQIRQRAHEDFDRIRRKVRGFLPESKREVARGIVGAWKKQLRRPRRSTPEMPEESSEFDCPGWIALSEEDRRPLATVAHELGHACTREEDFFRREGGDWEWTSELCADFYAYKWGFGREIAREKRHRRLAHHGPGRGEVVIIGSGPALSRYKVTRRFYLRLIQTETPSGEIIETAAQIKARQFREFEERRRFLKDCVLLTNKA